MDEDQKNRQLKYIQEHFSWLIILSSTVIAVILLVIGLCIFAWSEYKDGQRVHTDLYGKHDVLERIIK